MSAASQRPASVGWRRCGAAWIAVRRSLVPGLCAAGMLGLGVIAKVPADVPPALSTLIQQAKAGVPAAEFTLGLAYYEGKDGLHPNPVKALYWFRKAAAQRYAQAEYVLGIYHTEGGGGLHPNSVKALYWYRKAAAQGFKPAIAKLQALENSPRTKLARSAPQPAQAPAAAPIDDERVARSLQSFWTLYFRASNAQVVDFGTPALVRPVGFGN